MRIFVNGSILTEEDINNEINLILSDKSLHIPKSQIRKWAIDNAIERELILQDLLNKGIDNIDEYIENNFPDEDSFDNYCNQLVSKAEVRIYNEKISNIRKQLNFLLVKPAGPDCNLSCDYCFYLAKNGFFKNDIHRMSDDILKELIIQSITFGGDSINFGWQGGEPTLMGIDFFRKAIEYQKIFGKGKRISNSLQTNGILIDKQWCEFLKFNDFLVGLSIDGPEHIHNRYRKYTNGKETFGEVYKSALLMLENDVKVNALAVVNNYSVQFPEEIYNFFKGIGLNYMQFIPAVEPNFRDKSIPAFFVPEPERYGDFLISLFDLWLGDFVDNKPTTYIRFFESLFFFYVNLVPPDCVFQKECGTYLVVEHNGNVYSCDFFVDNEHYLGNIKNNNMLDLLNSDKQISFGLQKARLPQKCLSCEWLNYCHGGCIKDRFNISSIDNVSFLCEGYKKFFSYADKKFIELAEKWQKC